MLKLFGKWVIGGRSGKREQAWALFVLWGMAFARLMNLEKQGLSMPSTEAILMLGLPLAVANLALAHGMEWSSTQTRWTGQKQSQEEWDGTE